MACSAGSNVCSFLCCHARPLYGQRTAQMSWNTEVEVILGADLTFCQVLVKENGRSFSHFLTNLCAIIGGVFTVGLPDLTFLT